MQADEFKAVRTSLGWTQQELADALGMSPAAIVEMERGEAPIERRTALAARYLALSEGANGLIPMVAVPRMRLGPQEVD